MHIDKEYCRVVFEQKHVVSDGESPHSKEVDESSDILQDNYYFCQTCNVYAIPESTVLLRMYSRKLTYSTRGKLSEDLGQIQCRDKN